MPTARSRLAATASQGTRDGAGKVCRVASGSERVFPAATLDTTRSRSAADGAASAPERASSAATSRYSATSRCASGDVARYASNCRASSAASAPSAYAAARSCERVGSRACSCATLEVEGAQAFPQLLHAQPDPGLHRAERLLEPLGDLRLRQPLEEGELDRLALGRREVNSASASAPGAAARPGRRARAGSGRQSPIAGDAPGRSAAALAVMRSRRPRARTRSSARLRAIIVSHAATDPRAASNRGASRQAWANASSTTSSASARWPTIR